MPTVYVDELDEPMSTFQLYATTPVVVSPAETSPTGSAGEIAVFVSRFTNVTVAFSTSPRAPSASSTTVAVSVTVAVEQVTHEVDVKSAPAYVALASSAVTVSVAVASGTVR